MTRTRMMVLAAACVLAVGAFVAAPVEQSANVRIRKDPQGYWFTDGDTKVLFYQAARKALPDGQAARSNYFHPLYDLDGNVLTEDFPNFTGAQGVVTPIENAVSASPWMDVSGSYGSSGKSGLTVLTHPSTTGFPQPWILRASGSMQNAVYPGRQPSAI